MHGNIILTLQTDTHKKSWCVLLSWWVLFRESKKKVHVCANVKIVYCTVGPLLSASVALLWQMSGKPFTAVFLSSTSGEWCDSSKLISYSRSLHYSCGCVEFNSILDWQHQDHYIISKNLCNDFADLRTQFSMQIPITNAQSLKTGRLPCLLQCQAAFQPVEQYRNLRVKT